MEVEQENQTRNDDTMKINDKINENNDVNGKLNVNDDVKVTEPLLDGMDKPGMIERIKTDMVMENNDINKENNDIISTGDNNVILNDSNKINDDIIGPNEVKSDINNKINNDDDDDDDIDMKMNDNDDKKDESIIESNQTGQIQPESNNTNDVGNLNTNDVQLDSNQESKIENKDDSSAVVNENNGSNNVDNNGDNIEDTSNVLDKKDERNDDNVNGSVNGNGTVAGNERNSNDSTRTDESNGNNNEMNMDSNSNAVGVINEVNNGNISDINNVDSNDDNYDSNIVNMDKTEAVIDKQEITEEKVTQEPVTQNILKQDEVTRDAMDVDQPMKMEVDNDDLKLSNTDANASTNTNDTPSNSNFNDSTQPIKSDHDTDIDLQQENEEELTKCYNLLNDIIKKDISQPFIDPVDLKSYPEYTKFIKKPMALKNIKDKMEINGNFNIKTTVKYHTAYEYANDIRLIWKNAKDFNTPGSGIFCYADQLSKYFERKFCKIVKGFIKNPYPIKRVKKEHRFNHIKLRQMKQSTLQQRKEFLNIFKQLNGDDMGIIIELIEKLAPLAIEHLNDDNNDEINIQVYNIPNNVCTNLINRMKKFMINTH